VQLHRRQELCIYSITCIICVCVYYGGGSTSPVRFCWFFVFRGSRFPRRLPQLQRRRRGTHILYIHGARCAPPGPVARCVSRVSQAFYPCTLRIIVNNIYAPTRGVTLQLLYIILYSVYLLEPCDYGLREPAKIDLHQTARIYI